MRFAGGQSGALVTPVDRPYPVFSYREKTRRVPASVQKLLTTAATLLRDGPLATIPTVVATTGVLDPHGVLTGDAFIIGAGDPSLTTRTIERLADALIERGVTRVDGTIFGDDDAWDLRIGGPDSSFGYDPWLGGQLRALAINRGVTAGRLQVAPAASAAAALTRALRTAGVKVRRTGGAGSAPPAATEFARVVSPTVAELAAAANVTSNNYVADMLLKGLGDRYGAIGSTAEGASVVQATLGALGVQAQVVDGSGLSRENRISPHNVVGLLRAIAGRPPLVDPFVNSLALAGESGTIARRMRGTPAAGNCHAKTGTLNGVSALAGYCNARNGRTVAFAILMQNVGLFTAHAVQDRMAASIARWDG